MSELNGIDPCPYCQSRNTYVDTCMVYSGNAAEMKKERMYWVVCNECDARSGRSNTVILTIAAWNRMSELWLKKN